MTKIKTLFIFAFSCFVFVTSAQTVKINEEGRKILEYPDGTWRYLQNGEEAELENSSEKKKVKEKKVKETTPKSDSRTKEAEFAARMAAIRQAEKIAREAERLDIKAKEFSRERLNLETALAVMRRSETPISFEERELLERRVLKSIEDESVARKKANKKQKEAIFYDDLVYMNQKKRQKTLEKYLMEQKANDQNEAIISAANTNDLSEVPKATIQKKKTPKVYKKYNPKDDVILNPPKFECKLVKDEVDEFTGKRIRSTEPQLLFTHTRDELKPYFGEKEHTVCHANTTALDGGIYVLSLQIAIASRTAKEEYGGLLSNGTILVILLDGSTISMINNRTDRGKYDASTDTYLFKGNYQIPPRQVKDLVEGEIDKIRVVWEKGYDLYEVYEMDFLRNHLQCFDL